MALKDITKKLLAIALGKQDAANDLIVAVESGGNDGVTELNGETGPVTLVAGANVTITPDGNGNIEIAASGGGGAGPLILELKLTTQQAIAPTTETTVLWNTVGREDLTYAAGVVTIEADGYVDIDAQIAAVNPGNSYMLIKKNGVTVVEKGVSPGLLGFIDAKIGYVPVVADDEIEIQVSFENAANIEPTVGQVQNAACFATIKFYAE